MTMRNSSDVLLELEGQDEGVFAVLFGRDAGAARRRDARAAQ